MRLATDDRLIGEALAVRQQARASKEGFASVRAEIADRVARFRAHQERFRLERDAFYNSVRATMDQCRTLGQQPGETPVKPIEDENRFAARIVSVMSKGRGQSTRN
jgi:hypothetical protein